MPASRRHRRSVDGDDEICGIGHGREAFQAFRLTRSLLATSPTEVLKEPLEFGHFPLDSSGRRG